MNKNLGDIKKKKIILCEKIIKYYIILKWIIESSKDDSNLSEKEINNNLYRYLFQKKERKQLKIQLKLAECQFKFVKKNLDGIISLIAKAFITYINSYIIFI